MSGDSPEIFRALEKEKVYQDQDKSESRASDEETMSENGDIEDVTETASETGDDLGHDNSENGNQGEIKDFETTTTDDSKNVAQIFLKCKFPCYYCNS